MKKVYVITTLSDLGDGAEVSVSAKETLKEAQSMMKELVKEYVEENNLKDRFLTEDAFYTEDMSAEYCDLDLGIFVKYEIHECYL